jgi:hypothetical protein
MTMSLHTRQATAALRRAAVRATLAPSVHNTQPWRLELRPNELRLFADETRRLRVLDPTGRQMTISCGCALLNARVALAAAGYESVVERLPDPGNPSLLARIEAIRFTDGTVDPLTPLDNVVDLRRTNRRRFADDRVPPEVIDVLEQAARAEGSRLFVFAREADRLAVARLSQQADDLQILNPAYRAELRAWTTPDPDRTDGVPSLAVPHVDGGAHDDVPMRDFDTHGMGSLPSSTHSTRRQTLLLLGTDGDNPEAWLRAGEALERILLEITRQGFVASPFTQVIEIAATRSRLRDELGLTMAPHVLLRIGRAAMTPATRRRRLVDVLIESD